ncbi:MAG: transcription antitermination factor NusB [Salinivirgaceae bacterium]|nr:transcription antitermination factor NusB [Salinivirgaceae bacterium]
MISRKLLRIKCMQVMYAWLRNTDSSINQFDKELAKSVNSFEDLYYSFFQLLIEIHNHQLKKIERRRSKHLPTQAELNPNMRFVENPALMAIVESEAVGSYVRNNLISWDDNPELIKKLVREIEDSNFYNMYMVKEGELEHKDHKELLTEILIGIFSNSDELFEALEEKSVFWNDDIELVLSMSIRTIERIKRTYRLKPMKLYKNEADKDFVFELFRKTTVNFKDLEKLIQETASNWELERIALMDKIIIAMGVTELTNFPEIPVRVTLNEYIDMAKYYSTEKSNTFINGILDKLLSQMRENNKLNKVDGANFDKRNENFKE